MNKVALKTIGFEEQNEVNDQWVQQQEQQDRSLPDVYIDGIHRFRSIDQRQASMTEELTMDENGSHYRQQVQFTVRTEYDRELAKKYERRPLVLHVWTVDGHHYKIGTKSYPAYFVPSKTNSMDTVETSLTVEYETLTPIM
jgi:hypothetical protein